MYKKLKKTPSAAVAIIFMNVIASMNTDDFSHKLPNKHALLTASTNVNRAYRISIMLFLKRVAIHDIVDNRATNNRVTMMNM